MLPAGRLRLATSPGAIGSAPIANTMGIVVVAALAANAAGVPLIAAIAATLRRIGGERRQPLVIALRPAVFDRNVAALDETRPIEALTECGQDEVQVARPQTAEESNHRHRRLLRARRQRPKKRKRRSAAHERYELAALHSITSSASAS